MADKLLKSIKFPTLPDRYVIGDTSLSEEGAAADAKAVGEALATKADTKGRYEDLIVGGAEQLMADGYETDTEPYLFRTTGGSADVGNREYLDSIVGGTVGWNQLLYALSNIQKTGGSTSVSGGIVTFTADSANQQAYLTFYSTPNHVYLSTATFKTSTATNLVRMRAYAASPSTEATTNWQTVGLIEKVGGASNYSVGVQDVRTSGFDPIQIKALQTFDLTAMFGTTIADYIYSLEQAQAGAGVAWFRNYFPKDYYPYDPGTLRSVEGVSAHETVGFNQWDEEWVNGYYNRYGMFTAASGYVASNKIKLLPDTAYFISSQSGELGRVCLYDGNENFTRTFSGFDPSTQYAFRTSSKECYVVFDTKSAYGAVYKNDICINLSDPSRNGEYEPYTKHTYPLDSSLTLRGVPKLDSSNRLYYDGDEYESDGTVTRKYGIVDLGTLTPTVRKTGSVNKVISVTIPNAYKACPTGTTDYALASAYSVNPPSSAAILTENVDSNSKGIYFYANSSPDDMCYIVLGANESVSGYLVYELATQTTETAEPYQEVQVCSPYGTEEFVTTGIVPVGHETRYPHDLKKKIETAPDSPSTDGTYLMKRSGGKNAYMALPSTPSANGAYVLTVTVSGGTASYSWTSKE